ncbi:tRNA lysidine(34) synthetase TilS [Helicobacter sp. 11S02596-1]|uniref:tRNA lysidine(34) synthetase TilS n=1 Tax=Helicobacter sp. 11S02596-1 TaxID=1476194 RepID=UPI000BA5B955|nr:tRNA lysidine(34) synthetase TilS [Helicobacter sp. 11S02596-1]PAF44827.1 tRNA lysidine(34) synthetase TilS [Helicobacter sp. 11S02596-1]
MLECAFLPELKGRKNLLGFSGGPDSVALFYALAHHGIGFDMAIVDYGLRESCKDEVAYAQALAQEYQKECFVLKSPKIETNFEASARRIRYDFFEELIAKEGYENLVLAHHLGDRLEWFLMQLTKGCSLGTLLGFDGIEVRENYQIIRPLINTPKSKIYAYCLPYKFFEDKSNQDTTHRRNEFRHNYANALIEKYSGGIVRSFAYLASEKSLLYPKVPIARLGEIRFFARKSAVVDMYWSDKILKTMGYVLSASQRQEVLKTDFCLCIAQKNQTFILGSNQTYIFISKSLHIGHAPPARHLVAQHRLVVMPKRFKDIARKLKIPPNIRAQIYVYLSDLGLEVAQMADYLKEKLSNCE